VITMNDGSETGVEQDANYYVVIDSFGADWTPVAALTDAQEAIELRKMLEADAEAVVATAPYYESKQDVRDGDSSEAPEGIDYLAVAFDGKELVAISDDDWATREAQIEMGGLRGGVDVYDTAQEVAVDKPSVVGEFIVSQLSADDILEAVR